MSHSVEKSTGGLSSTSFVLGGFESTRFMNEACVIPVLLFGSENGEPVLEKFSC